MSRPIDADALIPDFLVTTPTNNTPCKRYVSMEQIHNAPTIEPEITQEDIELYCRRRCLTVITDDHYNEMKMRWSAQPEYTDAEIQKMQDLEQAQIEKAYQLGYEEGRNEAQRWIPCSERLPEEECDYLCWEWLGFCYVDTFKGGKWKLEKETRAKCIAWMPLPELYKEPT